MNKTYLLRYLQYPPCDDCLVEKGKPCDKELKEPIWCYLKLMSEEEQARLFEKQITEECTSAERFADWEKENEIDRCR